MGVIRLNLSNAELQSLMQAKANNIVNAMVQRLQFTGERFVSNVRTKVVADDAYRAAMQAVMARPKVSIATPRYKDRTANLTSSIGYLIQNNGKVLHSGFPGSGVGRTIGEAVAKETAARFPAELVLIVVAGMQYAAAVESKGYDVLTGSGFIAEKELKEALQAMLKRR